MKEKGLPEEILATIDPLIRELVDEINKLSFVKKTLYSCSGHVLPEGRVMDPYITIVYDSRGENVKNIPLFHAEIISIPGIRMDKAEHYMRRIISMQKQAQYYLQAHPDRTIPERKKIILGQWKAIEKIVQKYRQKDEKETKEWKELITENPALLDDPDILFKCPKCGAVSRKVSARKICHYCKNEVN